VPREVVDRAVEAALRSTRVNAHGAAAPAREARRKLDRARLQAAQEAQARDLVLQAHAQEHGFFLVGRRADIALARTELAIEREVPAIGEHAHDLHVLGDVALARGVVPAGERRIAAGLVRRTAEAQLVVGQDRRHTDGAEHDRRNVEQAD
jgi:hypothetical protein